MNRSKPSRFRFWRWLFVLACGYGAFRWWPTRQIPLRIAAYLPAPAANWIANFAAPDSPDAPAKPSIVPILESPDSPIDVDPPDVATPTDSPAKPSVVPTLEAPLDSKQVAADAELTRANLPMVLPGSNQNQIRRARQ